jgi:hypothetical protein
MKIRAQDCYYFANKVSNSDKVSPNFIGSSLTRCPEAEEILVYFTHRNCVYEKVCNSLLSTSAVS